MVQQHLQQKSTQNVAAHLSREGEEERDENFRGQRDAVGVVGPQTVHARLHPKPAGHAQNYC